MYRVFALGDLEMPPEREVETLVTGPDVWIIILNYCSLEDTLECVRCVRQVRYSRKTLLVIDNASPDGSGRELAKVLASGEFLQLTTNTGYAGGNNVGIGIAVRQGADFVLIVNPDVRLPPSCIDDYVSALGSDPIIGALNSVQVQADGATIDPAFQRAIIQPMIGKSGDIDLNELPERWKSTTLFGAALFLRRECIERVGGFDPLYFAYGEDVDLCRRIRHHGFDLVVQREPTVIHLRTGLAEPWNRRILFLRLKGAYLYRIKDLDSPFIRNFARGLGELGSAWLGFPPDRYPFNRYPIRRVDVLATMAWLVRNSHRAYLHRRGDATGPMYL